MNTYRIIVVVPGGNCFQYYGIYSDGFLAVMECMDDFPAAKRISVRRMP
jgi:hypothetical protein